LVLSSGSAVAIDFVGTIKPNMTDKAQVRLVRILCVVFVAISFAFATLNITFIVNLMSFSWGTVAGCFIGPFLWGLYWKGTTKIAAWAGALSGLIVIFGQAIYFSSQIGFDMMKPMIPQFGVTAMIVSLLIVPVVSIFTKKFSEEHISRCFENLE
ncbi:MAG: sodium:solute symporter family transporter, partial [Anaerovoracaceae bacterium]